MAKATMDIRSLARTHTAMAIGVLAGVARSKGAPPSARVAAANSLLDRGWGRAEQVHSGPDGGDIQVVIRHIMENHSETNEIVVIDALPNPKLGIA